MKIAETRVIYDVTGDYPVLLLDDVLSELDDSRKQRLLELGGEVQIILTSANPIISPKGKIFGVKNGVIA